LNHRPESRSLVEAATWLSLLALCAAVAFQKIRTFDYWWHLRTGELIIDIGAVPTADPYTYTVAGAPWIDSQWLYQVGLYAVHAIGGHGGVVFAKFALVVLTVGLLATIGYRRSRPDLSAAVLALALLAVFERVMPRPELASFALLAAVLALLERFRRTGDGWVYAILPVQLVWVNVHGLWVLAPVACAAYLAVELLRPLADRGARRRPERLRRLAALLPLSLLVALANPNGFAGALYPLHFLGMLQPGEQRDPLAALIRELDPLIGGRYPLDPLALSFFAGLAGLGAAAMLLNRRRVPLSDPILFTAFLGLALSANRNLALFAIVTAPLVVRNVNEFLDAHPIRLGRRARAAVAALAPLLLLAAAGDVVRGGPLARLREHSEPGLGIHERLYPENAAAWIARERPPGQIAHHQADGGYLIWRLYPEYRVMLDGRLEVFGGENLIDLSYRSPADFRRLDGRFRFGTVLVHHAWIPSDALLSWLHRSPAWRLAFADDVAAVFVRRRRGAAANDLDVDLDSSDLFSPLPGPPGRGDFARRLARANFLYAMHRYRRALALWEETAAIYPDRPDVGFAHARFLYGAGAIAAGDALLDRLLAERPTDALLRSGVGKLRLAAGRRDEAVQLFEAALALDPELEPALIARARLAAREHDAVTAAALYRRLLRIVPPADPSHADIERRLRALEK